MRKPKPTEPRNEIKVLVIMVLKIQNRLKNYNQSINRKWGIKGKVPTFGYFFDSDADEVTNQVTLKSASKINPCPTTYSKVQFKGLDMTEMVC